MTLLRYPVPCARSTSVTNQRGLEISVFEAAKLLGLLGPGQTMKIPNGGTGEISYEGNAEVTATTILQECDLSFEPPPDPPTGEFLL